MKTTIIHMNTTDIPRFSLVQKKYLHKFPAITEFSLLTLNTDGDPISKVDYLVKAPEDKPYSISEKALEYSDLSLTQLEESGLQQRQAVDIIEQIVQESDLLVAHNYEFIKKMLTCSLLRYDKSPINKPSYCTMRHGVVPAQDGKPGKFPKLEELYKDLIGLEIDKPKRSTEIVDLVAELYAKQNIDE